MGGTLSAVAAGKLRRSWRFMGRGPATVLVAFDMQIVTGSGPGGRVIEAIAEGEPDGILTTWNVARSYPKALSSTGLVLRVDGGITGLASAKVRDDLGLLYRAEQAAVLGADAVALMVYPGARDETRSLTRLANLVAECEMIGLAVLAESIPGGWEQDIPWDVENIARAARICAELGADVVKTMAPHPVGDVGRVVEACDAPVVVLGGPRMDTEDHALRHAAAAVEAGASGICFGRNVWSTDDPRTMVRRLRRAVGAVQDGS